MTNLLDAITTTPGLPCRTDPEPWYSDNASERAWAQRQCFDCPLQRECAQYAIETREQWGVWGATTAADRRSFRDGRPWRLDDLGRLRLACGSEDAYRAHFGYREQPCEECRAAHDEHILEDRRRRLDAEHAKGSSSTGYHLHRRIGEPACEACLGAMRAASAAARRRKAGRGLRRPRAASVAPGSVGALPGAPAAVQRLRAA